METSNDKRLLVHTLAALLVTVLAAGCAKSPASTTTAHGLAPAGAKLLAIGNPPLSALIGDGGTVSIYDVTTQELKHTLNLPDDDVVMITVDLTTKSIVAGAPTTQPVADQAGGDQQKYVLLHPINTADRYAIYVSQTDDDEDDDADEEDDD